MTNIYAVSTTLSGSEKNYHETSSNIPCYHLLYMRILDVKNLHEN